MERIKTYYCNKYFASEYSSCKAFVFLSNSLNVLGPGYLCFKNNPALYSAFCLYSRNDQT